MVSECTWAEPNVSKGGRSDIDVNGWARVKSGSAGVWDKAKVLKRLRRKKERRRGRMRNGIVMVDE